MLLGIDCKTKHAKKLLKRLSSLKSTQYVENMGAYREDNTYTMLHIETTKTEEELDNWLYKVNHGCDYVGTFTVRTMETIESAWIN